MKNNDRDKKTKRECENSVMRNALAQQKNEMNTTAIKNETRVRKPCNALAEQKNETNTTAIQNETRVRKPCNVCEANAEAMKNNDRVSLSANDFEPCWMGG